MVRVVIADDHPLFVEALEVALTNAGLEVVGTAGDGAALLGLVEQTDADVALLDLEMAGMGDSDCLRELRRKVPNLKVILLSGHNDSDSINSSPSLESVCQVGKTVKLADLVATVRIMAAAAPVYSSQVVSPTQLENEAAVTSVGLTRRELEILRLVSEGQSNNVVARTLWVTEQTVKFHLSNVYRKLDVSNRTQASAKAHSLGLTSEVTAEPAVRQARRVVNPTRAVDTDLGRSRSVLG